MPGRVDFQSIGVTGLKYSGGVVREEYLRELSGQRGRQVYAEMSEQDAVLGAVLFAIEMMIRGVDWSIVPGSDDEEDVRQADFIQSCIDDMETPFKEEISEILTFLPYGWSVQEILYKLRQGESSDPTRNSAFADGYFGWRDWSIRAQDSLWQWIFDEEGHATHMIQVAEPDFKQRTIPLDKCLHFRTTTRKDNPEGISVLRKSYREWYFKRHLETIEGIGAERDLAGLPVMYVPAEFLRDDASPEDKAIVEYCKKLVTSIRRDEQEGLVLPGDNDPESGKPMFRVELLSTGGQRQFNTGEIISRKEKRMAGSMLADFIFLGQDKVGSYALSSDKTEMFSFALGAWMDGICEVVNPAIRKLLALNGWKPVNGQPRLYHGDIETVDPKMWSEFLSQIAAAGAPLTPDMFSYVFKKVGLPVPEEGLEV